MIYICGNRDKRGQIHDRFLQKFTISKPLDGTFFLVHDTPSFRCFQTCWCPAKFVFSTGFWKVSSETEEYDMSWNKVIVVSRWTYQSEATKLWFRHVPPVLCLIFSCRNLLCVLCIPLTVAGEGGRSDGQGTAKRGRKPCSVLFFLKGLLHVASKVSLEIQPLDKEQRDLIVAAGSHNFPSSPALAALRQEGRAVGPIQWRHEGGDAGFCFKLGDLQKIGYS